MQWFYFHPFVCIIILEFFFSFDSSILLLSLESVDLIYTIAQAITSDLFPKRKKKKKLEASASRLMIETMDHHSNWKVPLLNFLSSSILCYSWAHFLQRFWAKFDHMSRLPTRHVIMVNLIFSLQSMNKWSGDCRVRLIRFLIGFDSVTLLELLSGDCLCLIDSVPDPIWFSTFYDKVCQ